MKRMVIDNIPLVLSDPVTASCEWIGQREPLRQLLACWLTVSPRDLPLTPRLIGYPGVGKTTLAMSAALQRGQDVYIMQCTADTRPEDLLVSPVLSQNGTIAYHASPLLSAVITGGVAILDEGNRMSEKSWASLAGLLDERRIVESIVAGISIKAHEEFRSAVTMNDDSSTFEIPDYIMSRLQPGIEIGFPDREDENAILKYLLPFCSDRVLALCVDFLQKAHGYDLPYSIRDGINMIRYTLKRKKNDPRADAADLFEKAIGQILGAEALDLDVLAEKRKRSGEHLPPSGLGGFFFDENDPLNPDSGKNG